MGHSVTKKYIPGVWWVLSIFVVIARTMKGLPTGTWQMQRNNWTISMMNIMTDILLLQQEWYIPLKDKNIKLKRQNIVGNL